MKTVIATALIATLSTAAFAGDTAHKSTKQVVKEPAQTQSVENKFPKSVTSQVLLGGLSEKHKEYLLRNRQQWDLYN